MGRVKNMAAGARAHTKCHVPPRAHQDAASSQAHIPLEAEAGGAKTPLASGVAPLKRDDRVVCIVAGECPAVDGNGSRHIENLKGGTVFCFFDRAAGVQFDGQDGAVWIPLSHIDREHAGIKGTHE